MWYRLIEVVLLALGLLIVPCAAEAQPVATVPQIGVLSFLHPSVNTRFWEAFRHSLREMGYVEDQNVAGCRSHIDI